MLHWLADGVWNLDQEQTLAVAKLLLEDGADPNAANSYGFTPLHFACEIQTRDAGMVELLLRFGADPNARDCARAGRHSICSGQEAGR